MRQKKRICIAVTLLIIVTLFSGCGVLDTFHSSVTSELGKMVVGEPEIIESISEDKYAYHSLSEEEQLVYDQVLDAILQQTDMVPVSTKDIKVLQKAYDCVMADYGGLFWVSGYQYNTYTSGKTVLGLEFMGNYTMSREERAAYQSQIDAKVEEWMVGISPGSSDYEKSKYVFETLISQVEYDVSSDNNQNILSVFLNQKTVCQGYADAVQYLLTQLQVPTTIITGNANGEPHAWNLVLLDGAYYYMDVTWGNSRYLDQDATEKKTLNYAYLNVTTQELSQTHIPDGTFQLPDCDSTQDNYFVQEGLYFDSWDYKAIGEKIQAAWKRKDEQVSVKMADDDLYHRLLSYFISEGHISDYCNGIRALSYIQDEEHRVLIFKLD